MMNDNLKQLRVVEVDKTNIGDINTMDNTFEVKSKVVLNIKGRIFGYSLEEISVPYAKSYPDDKTDYSTYIQNPDSAIFFTYVNHEVAGQIILKRWWNKFAWIEDLRVAGKFRRQGIGKSLMDAAVNWARGNGFPGIMLETQDINVPACLFYQKYGFILGGADKKLYQGLENSNETALFWYYIFYPTVKFRNKIPF